MNSTTMKAALIILVIVDHSNYSRGFIGEFLSGFTFHVIGFFFLSFLGKEKPMSIFELFKNQLFRYFYPFFVFTIGLSLIVWWFKAPKLSEHVITTAQALFFGDFVALKASTNLYLLWFLPTFISFLIVKKAFIKFAAKSSKSAFLILVFCFLGIPLIPHSITQWMPFAVTTAIYMLPIVVMTVNLYKFMLSKLPYSYCLIFSGTLLVLIKIVQIHFGLSQEVGFLNVSSLPHFFNILINVGESIFGVLTLALVCCFKLPKYVQNLGLYSLQIYMIHIFFAALGEAIIARYGGSVDVWVYVVSLVFTVLASTIAATMIMNNRVCLRFLFPKNYSVLTSNSSR